MNLILYGDVFGAHGIESLHGPLSFEERSEDALARATALGDMWLDSISVTWLVVLFVGLLLPARGRAGRIVRSTA
ncbi:MAG TPA: hypothetical protein RMH99_01510, partial [Sandaracinaceae bacterium LLY-WYZ-13_1]|nr:hypothetical protein [Sandaracinaceae bacterium LLY-WYZ-13_1]